MPDPAAASAAPATTLATGEQPAAVATPDAAAVAAAAEATRVAALTPEAKAAEETAKASADAKAKADASAEAQRLAALSPEARKAEEDAKAKAQADAKAKAVPEKYELTLPEGVTENAELKGQFETIAKELGLTQENAQKLYSLGAQATTQNTNALLKDVAALQSSWLTASEKDPEIGGDGAQEKVAIARTALKFATPELKQVLNETKLGNHPELVRWMYRVGKAMSEDTLVQGGKSVAPTTDSFDAKAARLYPNQQAA